jgi:H+/Cl- antiporter ClcA
MNQAEIQELYRQYFYYIVAAGVLIGVIVGAIPFILAIKRKRKGLGWLSLIVCAVTGALSPLLAAVISIVMVVIVLKSGPSTETNNAAE